MPVVAPQRMHARPDGQRSPSRYSRHRSSLPNRSISFARFIAVSSAFGARFALVAISRVPMKKKARDLSNEEAFGRLFGREARKAVRRALAESRKNVRKD